VLEAITLPVALQTNEHTRNAAVLTTLAVIDRKLDREHVYGTLVEMVNCNEYLRRAEMLARVIYDMERGELTVEKCQVALGGLLAQAEARRSRLQHLMSKVVEMPVEGDTLN